MPVEEARLAPPLVVDYAKKHSMQTPKRLNWNRNLDRGRRWPASWVQDSAGSETLLDKGEASSIRFIGYPLERDEPRRWLPEVLISKIEFGWRKMKRQRPSRDIRKANRML